MYFFLKIRIFLRTAPFFPPPIFKHSRSSLSLLIILRIILFAIYTYWEQLCLVPVQLNYVGREYKYDLSMAPICWIKIKQTPCPITISFDDTLLYFCFDIVKHASDRDAQLFSWKTHSLKVANILSVTLNQVCRPTIFFYGQGWPVKFFCPPVPICGLGTGLAPSWGPVKMTAFALRETCNLFLFLYL